MYRKPTIRCYALRTANSSMALGLQSTTLRQLPCNKKTVFGVDRPASSSAYFIFLTLLLWPRETVLVSLCHRLLSVKGRWKTASNPQIFKRFKWTNVHKALCRVPLPGTFIFSRWSINVYHYHYNWYKINYEKFHGNHAFSIYPIKLYIGLLTLLLIISLLFSVPNKLAFQKTRSVHLLFLSPVLSRCLINIYISPG